ncbi:MAG: porin family protein [Roseovarius sp.]|jgi:outer membrane immunogenic protein|nr:porin family protein [Roseovarius sp.]
MLKTTTMLATMTAFLAAPAFAGALSEPEPEPYIAPVAVVAPTSPNWTGFYAGGEIGYADFDATPGASDDGLIGGVILGYDYDIGNNFVVGGGLDYDFSDVTIGTTDIEEVFRAKLRGGYKIGNGLLYGTGGYTFASTNNSGTDDGYVVGGGYEHMLSPNFSVGGEVLYHDYGSFNNSGSDLDGTTAQIRASLRF